MRSRKAPRRTAERILAAALALFNRFGEPNVSTSAISAELRISPGNLYYHYPAKDALVNTLFDHYETRLHHLLAASEGVRDVEDAWFFLHSLLELIWDYRFLYRDLGHLLSRNRRLEARIPLLLQRKQQALRAMLQQLGPAPAHHTPQAAASAHLQAWHALATNMVVLLTWWLSYEYVLHPRSALEPGQADNALLRGASQLLMLLAPHLDAQASAHLHTLIAAYSPACHPPPPPPALPAGAATPATPHPPPAAPAPA